MQQLYRLNERRPCQVCGQTLMYYPTGWHHLRINGPHRGVPVQEDAPTIEMLQGRIAELEALVEVQGNRIRTALAENAKLTEKVKR